MLSVKYPKPEMAALLCKMGEIQSGFPLVNNSAIASVDFMFQLCSPTKFLRFTTNHLHFQYWAHLFGQASLSMTTTMIMIVIAAALCQDRTCVIFYPDYIQKNYQAAATISYSGNH